MVIVRGLARNTALKYEDPVAQPLFAAKLHCGCSKHIRQQANGEINTAPAFGKVTLLYQFTKLILGTVL